MPNNKESELNHIENNTSLEETAELLLETVPQLMRLIINEAKADEETLTFSQLRALGLLKRGPRLPSELARQMSITPATTSELVDSLVRRGLVTRGNRPEDRRCTPLILTPLGMTCHQAARQRALTALANVLTCLDQSEKKNLEHTLRLLLDTLRENERSNKGARRAD